MPFTSYKIILDLHTTLSLQAVKEFSKSKNPQ